MIQPSIVIEWLKHGHCKCSSCRGSEWKLLHRSKRFKEGCIFLCMALADSCQIYLQSGMLPEKVVDCFVFSRIFAERVDLLSYYSDVKAGVRVSHWCRSSASVAPARENACSAGIMDIVWSIVCPSILVSQGGGQELLSRHKWKELERTWYHWNIMNIIDLDWFWLILAYVRSSFDQGAAATWLHRGNMIPKASLNCMIIKMNQVIVTSSDCKCLVWEKWVGRYKFSAQGALLETKVGFYLDVYRP